MRNNTFKLPFLLIICAVFAFSQTILAQSVNMGGAGYPLSNTIPCATFSDGSTPNFFDDGGAGGNYSATFNDTIVFCPDLTQGTKVSVVFAINAGFSFDVHASDSIYVFDGPTTSAPLMGVHNSSTDPNGFTHTATWGNPTGCITIVFVSNAVNEGAGWQANVSCGNINQPFVPHLEAFVNGTGPNAINPADSGFVNLCFGDSVLLVAKPNFPNSQETTGYGYSQDVNSNITFQWTISSGGTYPNNDSIWFTPPSRNGFLVDLKMTDVFPQSERLLGKIRVSQLPSFAGTGPLQDTVCLGDNTELVGGVTPTDTVGVNIPEGTFQLGGSFAGLTYLPDGSGAQYQAPITISGFPAGSTISNAQDLNQVCITMEHSFLGDLEIALECPNGTQVALVNSYGDIFDPGFIPGGFNGGDTFLGDADDNSGNGVPGVGYEYCFSTVYNDWGNMGTELAAGNTVPTPISNGNAMNPNGVYLPEASFAGFAGCPVNGDWTIIVQDNLGIDDGYIFEWGLYFDGSFFAGLGGYQNYVVDDFWNSDPTIISDNNDTLIVIQPNVPGQYGYTYNVVDDYGCPYDTTVYLYVLQLPTVAAQDIACNLTATDITSTYPPGHSISWTVLDNPSSAFLEDTATSFINSTTNNSQNPDIGVSNYGTYVLSYSVSGPICNTVGTDTIYFPPYIYTQIYDTSLCQGVEYTLNAFVSPYPVTYSWNTGAPGTSIQVSQEATYIVTVTNECYSFSDSAYISYYVCDIQAPNVISLSSTTGNNKWFVNSDGIAEFNCTIVNRWGDLIYEFNDLEGSWDGRSQNGNFVEDGVYFYRIKAEAFGGREIEQHGFITVVK